MGNLTKGNEFLKVVSLKQLKVMYKKENNAKAKVRLLAAIYRKQKKSLDEISELLNMPRMTIHDCLMRFQNRGIEAKDSIKQTGKPPTLTKKQMKSLVKDLERGPKYNKNGLWSTKEVNELLKDNYNVNFVNQHVWRIITGLGFTLQRPRKKHYKSASPREMQEFKKKLKENPDTIKRRDLLWVHRMKQHSD